MIYTAQTTTYLRHLKAIILQTSVGIIKETLPFTFNFYGNEIAPYFPLQLTIALDCEFSETKLAIMNTNIMQRWLTCIV